ncbi:MAG: acyl-CoA dehydrogenase family protein [Pseudaminobacter sp.]
MDFRLPLELRMLQETARRFTEEELMPLEREAIENEMKRGMDTVPYRPAPGAHHVFDPDGIISVEKYQHLSTRARELGLWGLDVPAELGGVDIGVLGKNMVLEETHRCLVPFILPPDSPNLHWMMAVCTPEQRELYLEPYARGEISSCLAVSEPGAGADASNIRTKATRTANGWLLNGRKTWVSRADWCDFIIVLARTDSGTKPGEGVSAFLVDRNAPGVTIERRIATMGADRPCEISFENVELQELHVLGKVGGAFKELQNRFSVRRIEIAIRSLAASERLLSLLVAQANNRETFGAKLADRQAIQWWIADAQAEIHAVRLMCYHAAWKIDNGIRDVRYEASMLKVKATEMAAKVADWTIQAHGGMGLAKEMPIEFFYRMARYWRIVEGPSEVHRMVVARNRLKGQVPTIDPDHIR